MPKAILFDLDDTLTDRRPSVALYAERFHGDFMAYLASTTAASIAAAVLAADVRGYRPRAEVLRDFAQRLPWQTVPEISCLRTHWGAWYAQSVVARAGLETTLRTLHGQGIRLGIVTNGERLFQEPKITRLSIRRYLSTIVISEAVQAQKPDPRIFVQALSEVGCQAAETWFIGDDPVNDVLGAAALGLRAIWLTGVCLWPADRPAPLWQIATLGELVDLVHSDASTSPDFILSLAQAMPYGQP
jgi:putative hydrolase of the HAD superfamily